MGKSNSKYENLRLREPDIQPTDEVLKKTLGSSYDAYKAFCNKLADFGIEQTWTYYRDGTSWLARGSVKWTTPRGAKKEKTIYWLSAWDGFFKVGIYFKEKNRAEVQKASVSDTAKELITNAKTMGKLMTFPLDFDVYTNEPLNDIYQLMECKKRLELF